MNKRIFFALILIMVISTGAAFADFGIGVHGAFNGVVDIVPSGGLTLGFDNKVFVYFDAVGIYHFLGAFDFVNFVYTPIVKTLFFYVRLGLGFSLWNLDNPENLHFATAVRVPIGISWRPIKLIELFAQVLPQVGVEFLPEQKIWNNWFGGNVGVRFWFG